MVAAVEVRDAQPGEADALVTLWRELSTAAGPSRLPAPPSAAAAEVAVGKHLDDPAGRLLVVELDGEVHGMRVDPVALGMAPATLDDLRGGDPATNAALARKVLAGEGGHHRDIVVLNAAAGLVVSGLADDMAAGVLAAHASIDDGRAAAALDALVTTSVAARTAGQG